MRQRTNRQKVKTLYILGAGASMALTQVAPRQHKYNRHTTSLDSDFFLRLIDADPAIGWKKHSLKLVRTNWLEKGSKIEDYGLEAAIIKRVSDYDLLSSVYPDKSRRKCSNAEFLNHLSHLGV